MYPRPDGRGIPGRSALVGCGLAAVLMYVAGATGSGAPERAVQLWDVRTPRVVVRKSARKLYLFDGTRLVRVYPIDLGAQPTGTKQFGADRRTPEGVFRVVSRNADSPYHRFLGISYPDEGAILRGLASGLISTGQAAALLDAHRRGRPPNWTTALGGGIGIHGHRKGYDWTGGCIALSDEHVEELFRVLRLGDPVEILP